SKTAQITAIEVKSVVAILSGNPPVWVHRRYAQRLFLAVSQKVLRHSMAGRSSWRIARTGCRAEVEHDCGGARLEICHRPSPVRIKEGSPARSQHISGTGNGLYARTHTADCMSGMSQ